MSEASNLTACKSDQSRLSELCPDQGIEEIFYKDDTNEYIFEKISLYDDVDGYDYGSTVTTKPQTLLKQMPHRHLNIRFVHMYILDFT